MKINNFLMILLFGCTLNNCMEHIGLGKGGKSIVTIPNIVNVPNKSFFIRLAPASFNIKISSELLAFMHKYPTKNNSVKLSQDESLIKRAVYNELIKQGQHSAR